MFRTSIRSGVRILSCLLATVVSARGDLCDEIGLSALESELGPAMPRGSGIPVLHAEFAFNSAFAPDATDSRFTGKNLILNSWAPQLTAASGHATTVASVFYGTGAGIAPAVSTIQIHEAWHYAYESARLRKNVAPVAATWKVENHSWVGEATFGSTELLRRVDYRTRRDDVLVVSSLNNGSTTDVPTMFGHLYNGLVVGVSNGAHSRGGTLVDGAGRSKPDLVAPSSATSFAAPAVAGAAALLLGEGEAQPRLADVRHIEALKAILLAGTTRDEFPEWAHTHKHPLDPVFGVGELNIQRSHHILLAGKHASSGPTPAADSGWDFGTVASEGAPYVLEIPAGGLSELTVALTWHRTVSPSPDFTAWDSSLTNLDLQLWRIEPATLVAESRSTVDNVEFITVRGLPAGRYVLVLLGDETATNYGLAWHFQAPPTPPEPNIVDHQPNDDRTTPQPRA